jgi:hypothetical protein
MILVLVDVDNLLGGLPALPAPGQLKPSRLLRSFVPSSQRNSPVVVSMAMNLRSAATFAGWKDVQQLASDLARRIAPRSSEIHDEVALCLSVPEAADQALLRMLQDTSRPDEDAIQEVWLVSYDEGLARQVQGLLPLCVPRKQAGCWSWSLPSPRPRAAPSPTVVFNATEPLSPVIARIDSCSRCATVARKQVQCPTDWPVLLEAIARNPWLLSQVGVTLHDGSGSGEGGSVRGVARLQKCLALSPEAWLECAPKDGVEYAVEGFSRAWNLQVESLAVREASVGPGALRIEWTEQMYPSGLTLRCQLPAWLVARLAATLPRLTIRGTSAGEPRLDESSVLGTFCGKVGGPVVKVRLARYKGVLQAKATSERSCWWWIPRANRWIVSNPKVKYNVPGADRLLPSPLDDIDAVQGVAPGPILYLRSPLVKGTLVDLPSPLRAGTLGRGTHRGQNFAVLAPQNLPAGPVACAPIQNVTVGLLFRLVERAGFSPLEAAGIVPLLRELPLVVPLAPPRAPAG